MMKSGLIEYLPMINLFQNLKKLVRRKTRVNFSDDEIKEYLTIWYNNRCNNFKNEFNSLNNWNNDNFVHLENAVDIMNSDSSIDESRNKINSSANSSSYNCYENFRIINMGNGVLRYERKRN